jgi:hypothetical protein
MMNWWNPFSWFYTPTAEDLARNELASAQRDLLTAQSNLEYSRAMTEYNTQRVARLEATVKGFAPAPKGVDSFRPVLG